MLFQRLIHLPQAVAAILNQTPHWVWGLLAGLIALGASQLVRRQMSLPRTLMLPLATSTSCFGRQ